MLRVKIEHDPHVEDDRPAWTVFTSKDGNGWWGITPPFFTEEAAQFVADAITTAANCTGALVDGHWTHDGDTCPVHEHD